jgi:hypothetical protein
MPFHDKPLCVGDVVITADGDTGRITKLFPASPGWNENDDPFELMDAGEHMPGAVIDLGPLIGKFAYNEDYFWHHDGPVPDNSEGFMAEIVLTHDMRVSRPN